MPNLDVQPVMLILAAIIPLVGATMAITPRLQPRSQVFSVSVPTAAWEHPRVRQMMRRYFAIVLAVAIAFTLVALAFCLLGNAFAVLTTVIVATLVLFVLGYGLILRYRAQTQKLKRASGWEAEAQQRVAAVGESRTAAPRGISLAWNWLYAPVLLLTAAVAVAGYGAMPDQLPMHVDVSGTVTSTVAKSPAVAAFPLLIEVFLAAVFAFSHWTALCSKKGTEPGNPASSAWAYGMFAHAQTTYLLVGGLAVTAAVGLSMELVFIGVVSMGSATVFIVAVAMLLAVASIVVSLVYGQSGSRVFRMEPSEKLLTDDDAHWKFGLLYCNPDDASLFCPQRVGFGWTANWARPAVWAIAAAGVAVTALFVVACVMLAG